MFDDPPRRARALAVLGTGSDVGKSVLAAALCRLFARSGADVAPFKAQNMSNNSAVTPDGLEIGRAQALQAEACFLAPHVDMNPILLKPESESSSQVVLLGRPLSSLAARAYFERVDDLYVHAAAAYDRLAARHGLVVLEGAGSAAELNLERWDLVNWRMVEHADARVILVADIERGGVFAQVLGTLDLLPKERRARVAGVIVNKFRGDPSLFDDGVRILRERGGVPVLGVVPLLKDAALEDEDSLPRGGRAAAFRADAVNVAVVLLPRMSNFTDARALAGEPDVALRFVATPRELAGADVVVLPGSKNTLDDLASLRERGFEPALASFRGAIVGLCGGFQMLGRSLADPQGVEGGVPRAVDGLALLDVATVLKPHKITRRACGSSRVPGVDGAVSGYEIHCGSSARGADACALLIDGADEGSGVARTPEGATTPDGRVFGSYLHGLFDAPAFRRAFLNRERARKGLAPLALEVSMQVSRGLGAALDRFADHVGAHLDRTRLHACVDLGVPGA